MKRQWVSILGGLALAGGLNCSRAESSSFTSELAKAAERGRTWLASQQGTNGAWEPSRFPAITALVLAACESTPGAQAPARPEFIAKGYHYLLDNLKPDGGIYTGTNYQNYNTSLSLVALSKTGDPKYRAVYQKARPLIMSWQVDLNEKGKRDNPLDGGMGYGDGTPRANLANTLPPLQALYETKSFATNSEHFNHAAIMEFLHHSQNFASVNPEPWVYEDEANRGGFVYHPGKSFAGEFKQPNGQPAFRSYGSMTYVGLLCYLYAGVDPKKPEVRTALDWAQRHFNVDENPAMGQQGLFYYYHLMARALAAYHVDKIKTADGQAVDWRETLGRKLISLQKPDGSWVNSESRWMEDNPALCTAYALLALKAIDQKN